MKRALISTLSLFVLIGCVFAAVGLAQTHKPAKKKPTAQKPAQTDVQPKPADARATDDAQTAQSPASAPPTPTPTSNETQPPSDAKPIAPKSRRPASASKQAAAQAEFEALLALPAAERVVRLQKFLDTNPPAPLKTRALEHLVSAHAALADEKLQAGDVAGGGEEFKQAVALAPADMSDKLFVEVVSQFPANLFLRGQREAAFAIAQLIEAKVKDNPQRLLVLSAFYLNIEQVDEAARLAEAARTLAPDLAAAHQALGAAERLALKLDEATSEYKRALELDPKSAVSRRNLADLLRATGKPEDALALYREQLASAQIQGFSIGDPVLQTAARTGVVLSLLDAGKREEAERELEAALKDEPRNLPLLVGAAYWFAAHGEAARALELAGQAVAIEPRYTWAQVVLARALIAQKRAFEAERALRFAREYGRFPTLDYELANALAAAGLYEEAAEELARTFTLKDGQLETQLAGRVPARAASFTELLAPERRASLFQATPADTDANARMLKGLLAFYLALNAKDTSAGADESALNAAVKDFTAGDDDLRAFRQLYAADRLARRGLALNTAAELAEAAKSGVEAAADTPVASVAIAADELRLIRERAINAGGTPDFPAVSREAISKIMRGRTEELIGWSLFNQGKTSEAVTTLRRALSVLPERSLYWRNAEWRLGAALAADGQQKEALAAYLKSYDSESPDLVRRAIIETLYTKVNGSLTGLDALIGPAPAQVGSASADAGAPPAASAAPTPKVEAAATTKVTETATANEPPKAAETPKVAEPSKPEDTPKPEDKTATKVEETTANRTSVPPATENKPLAPPAPAEPSPTPSPTPSPIEQTQPPAAADSSLPPAATQPLAPSAPVPVADKPAEPNSTGANSTEAKPTETKPTETKSTEPKPAESAEPKSTETKSAGSESAPAPVNEKPASADENKSEARAQRPRIHSQRAVNSNCALTLSVGSMLLTSNGGSSAVVASLEGQGNSADITATTADWADIIVLREPQDPAPNAARYTVTSISKKTGTFVVTFKSPCGTKEVSVTVK